MIKFIIFVILVSCSSVNQESKDQYVKGQKFRHGIIPAENFKLKNLGLKKELTPEYSNNLRSKLGKDLVERGRILYEKNCIQCHGPQGMGDGVEAAGLAHKPANLKKTVQEVRHFKFYMSISQMEGNMPGWKTHFTEIEREELVAYIQTFK